MKVDVPVDPSGASGVPPDIDTLVRNAIGAAPGLYTAGATSAAPAIGGTPKTPGLDAFVGVVALAAIAWVRRRR